MALGVSAANWHGMKVMLKDDSDVHILLTDSFVASFTDTDFHLENEKTKFDVPRVQISSMRFTEDAPADSGTDAIADDAAPSIAGGKMIFSSLPAGSKIAVFTEAGIEVMAAVASGAYELDLASLPKGNCIVTVNRTSYKVYLK